ncbi:MAG TPA: pectate lyase [Vicinamibacterales bacterium]|nr:pectate lyase [Vicinamibacterales bacterium]
MEKSSVPIVLAFLCLAAAQVERPDAVVASDGSAQYRTVQEAINAAPQSTDANHRWVIFIKAGTYHELVYVQREKRFVALVGEDPARTIITYGLKASDAGLDGQPIGTFRTPTMYVDADDFSAENLTIQNDAGPVGQALAIRVDGDRVVLRNCRFLGWQDTMLLDRGRQYIEDAFIAGHVDFIFGGATAFFERAHVHAWRDGYLTAASTPAEQPFGFVFANGQITADSPNVKTYLGRPWRDFAQVTFLNTRMTDVIRPAGWHNWDRPERERTARFSEFGSTGPGASATERVAWAKPLSAADVQAITVIRVLAGSDGWDPARVPAHPSAGKANAAPLPRPPGAATATPPIAWADVLRQPDAWYGSDESIRIAGNVVLYQRHTGGWPKNLDKARALNADERVTLLLEQAQDDSTIDNGATVTEMRYLARVYAATRDDLFRTSFLAGVDFLLAAQYANGGWPQYFPLRGDYSRRITFNDEAMTGVLQLLDDVARARPMFAFVDAARRTRANDAVARGVRVILATQIHVGPTLTGWCQQHDETTLAPAAGRAYEHPSIASRETVSVVRFLMQIDKPDAAVIASIDAAVVWLKKAQLSGIRVDRRPDPAAAGGYDVVVADDAAAPPIWARFYEIGTNRPIFSGRDGIVRYRLAEIELERRTGYAWYGTYATALLADEYPAWVKRVR